MQFGETFYYSINIIIWILNIFRQTKFNPVETGNNTGDWVMRIIDREPLACLPFIPGLIFSSYRKKKTIYWLLAQNIIHFVGHFFTFSKHIHKVLNRPTHYSIRFLLDRIYGGKTCETESKVPASLVFLYNYFIGWE